MRFTYGTFKQMIEKMIYSMGANVRPYAIAQAGKALGPVHSVCQAFEEQSSLYRQCNYPPVSSMSNLHILFSVLWTPKWPYVGS